MLKLCNITKKYETGGELEVVALNGVSIEFRRNEFVSVLGHSGCGKTTLLNIVGGLDRYTEGDLIIDGVSTKEYKDRDWDTYRNHPIGFVFQSYNLIPHQTVLSNVELALTLSGIGRQERRKRAIEALKEVGLGNQLHKKPNQMSGGQMQRVAIARALINNPEILLADEPTGALDSETSEQIMELLKEVAKDRLVIMVTHNPELAERYSTRIVKLSDGEVIGDTAPYDSSLDAKPETVPAEEAADSSKKKSKNKKKNKKKHIKANSMSFFTALSLSLNNLMTKKGRTFMTSFAGSIGIIGIALILSLSSGFKAYIDTVQEEALSSYPISIDAEQVDMSQILLTMMSKDEDKNNRADGKVYANTDMYDMLEAMGKTNTNNLEKFKVWLEKDGNEVMNYISAIQYGYSTDLQTYAYDLSNGIVPTNDFMSLFTQYMSGDQQTQSITGSVMNSGSLSVFQEILKSKDGNGINPIMYEQYELVEDGMKWPSNKNEVVLVVDKNNELSETFLFTLGLLDRNEISDMMMGLVNGKDTESHSNADASWTYDDIMGMKFRLILPTDKYEGYDTDGDGVKDKWVEITKGTTAETEKLYEEKMRMILGGATELTVVGIIRPKEDVTATVMTGAIGYLPELTDWYLEEIAKADIVKQQLADPTVDVLTGLPFKTADYKEPTHSERATMFKEWASQLSAEEKVTVYSEIFTTPTQIQIDQFLMESTPADRDSKIALIIDTYNQMPDKTEQQTVTKEQFEQIDDNTLDLYVSEVLTGVYKMQYAKQLESVLKTMPETQKLAAFEQLLLSDDVTLSGYYDSYIPSTVSESTYVDTLEKLGYAVKSKPSSINIYASSFENKEKIASFIASYNKTVSEDDQITYTDYVAIMMSSVSTIIDVISYVLIAFVSISLVVSSIMIGIITYISVFERTKEIGILRSIGASKKDISRVFNAETLIVGFVAGMIGIIVTMLLNIPINIIIEAVSGIKNVAFLPTGGAVILVAISMILTFVAGLVPSRVAAKKDPVEALRTE